MLISYGAKNFYCFKELVTIDFSLSPKVPESVSGGKKFARTMCLKGANASGKTNAIKILYFIAKFCTNSFSLKPDEEIRIDSFFDNREPAELFVEFMAESTWYRYELTVTKEGIVSEKIFKKDKRKTLVFHREGSSINTNLLSSRKEIPNRKNASIISTLIQFEEPSVKPMYDFFDNIITNVYSFGFLGNPLTHNALAFGYQQNPEIFEFTKQLIKRFDTGVVDITISSYIDNDGKTIYFPMYHHETTEGQKLLGHLSQSSGTQSLFKDLFIYGRVLESGGVLALDEFDTNLHPSILPHLVKLFEDPETNPKDAQVIFSTHNNEIIDVLGKYRTYLFNKRDGECFGYRLDEIDSDVIRNDRPILPLYLAGKIGGTPRI